MNIVRIAAAFAVLIGSLTILSGGIAIFGGTSIQEELGNVVPLVLWFNFASGFAYVLAGIGLWAGKHWSVWFSAAITIAIFCAWIVLGMRIAGGGLYEMRTIGAMLFRFICWLAISWIAIRHIGWKSPI